MRIAGRQSFGQAIPCGRFTLGLRACLYAHHGGVHGRGWPLPVVADTSLTSMGRETSYFAGRRYDTPAGTLAAGGYATYLSRGGMGNNWNTLTLAALIHITTTNTAAGVRVGLAVGGSFLVPGFAQNAGGGLNEFSAAFRGGNGTYYTVSTADSTLRPRFGVIRIRSDDRMELWVDGAYVGQTSISRGGFNTAYENVNMMSAYNQQYCKTGFAAVWDRWLTDEEVRTLSADPLAAMFHRDPLDGIDAQIIGSYQYARPSADVTTNNWSSTGTSFFSVTDEVAHDDADYIYSTTLGAVCELDLSSVNDPTVHTGHTIRYRARSQYGGTAWFELSEGFASVATWTQVLTTSWATYSYTLSSGEAAAIGNYGDLAIRMKAL